MYISVLLGASVEFDLLRLRIPTLLASGISTRAGKSQITQGLGNCGGDWSFPSVVTAALKELDPLDRRLLKPNWLRSHLLPVLRVILQVLLILLCVHIFW